MVVYHKLVRDKIPDIIRNNGSECEVRVLNHEEYIKMLEIKIEEELKEYLESHNVEELADLLEVIFATAKARGISEDELHEIRRMKQEARGGFDNRLLLVSTTD